MDYYTMPNGVKYFVRGRKQYWYIDDVDSQKNEETFIIDVLAPFEVKTGEAEIIIKSRTVNGEKTDLDERMYWMLRGNHFSQYLHPLSTYMYMKKQNGSKKGHRYLQITNTRVRKSKKVFINTIYFPTKNRKPKTYPLLDIEDMRYIRMNKSGSWGVFKGVNYGTVPELDTAMCLRDVLEKAGFPTMFASQDGKNPDLKRLHEKCAEYTNELQEYDVNTFPQSVYDWIISEYPEIVTKEPLEQEQEGYLSNNNGGQILHVSSTQSEANSETKLKMIVEKFKEIQELVEEVSQDGNL